jgi:hypothetical protein
MATATVWVAVLVLVAVRCRTNAAADPATQALSRITRVAVLGRHEVRDSKL